MISPLDLESRLPVGSSARMSGGSCTTPGANSGDADNSHNITAQRATALGGENLIPFQSTNIVYI